MSEQKQNLRGIHQSQPVLAAGKPLAEAKAVMVLIHGRGATAESILTLADEFKQPEFAYLAPQAAGNTWYPERFTAPIERNEPWLSSAFAVISNLISYLLKYRIPQEQVMLLGFSQGACLVLEFVARNTGRYGGIVGLSGALIGPDDLPRHYSGSLDGTPVFLGCSATDFHIPRQRVDQAADQLRGLGGVVTERIYPNLDHAVNQDEIDFIRTMMEALVR